MIRLVLSDLDGTLINSRRELTTATRQAVRSLREAGIAFALVSGRPPLGLRDVIRELEVETPVAAFNGGMLIRKDLSVLEQRCLSPQIAAKMIGRLDEMGLDPWVYRGSEWLIRDASAPHVSRESATVGFAPRVVSSFELKDVVKIVGVSDDPALVERAERELGGYHSGSGLPPAVKAARSQDYYLDITHPDANKGAVVKRLSEILRISPTEIATLGDMPSDLAMFSRSGISFAMGNAGSSVKAKATAVVPSNDSDGFSKAAGMILKMSEGSMNRLIALHDRYGQSPWLDSIDREFIESGKLHELVYHHGLRGLTSNPSIFEKAMTQSDAYDAQIESLLGQGDREDWEVKALYEELAVTDVQAAADVLRPIYEQGGGATGSGSDGFVSFEVAPSLARDTRRTVDEARALWKKIDRPNVMIKVPGTAEGVPAVRELIAAGINVNITLLFSRSMYRRVAQAYLEGLEDRVAAGKPIDRIASVASFFVSRIDSLVDKRLGESKDPRAPDLQGKIAIANAKLAYAFFRELIESDRWKKLAAAGARPQRLLWASTSTKNPAYRDVLYVEELIGSDTVNTLPPSTMQAFEDHGMLRESLVENVDQARQTLERLSELGISLDEVTDRLTEDAIRLFSEPFDSLMLSLERKKRRKAPTKINPLSLRLPILEMTLVGETLKEWKTSGKIRRLWARDSSLWTGKDESKWLGWLGAVDTALGQVKDLERCRAETTLEGIREIILLGMGGSSLAPEVFQMTFEPPVDRPDIHVLDSTDPEQIARIENMVGPSPALFIVSSKSGTTLEPNLLLEYFYEKSESRFIAVTDPGSQLERTAHERGFFRVFHGNPEIGGRYSALSAFGLAPAAMMGVDIVRILTRAQQMVHSCSENVPPEENPGVILGAVLGALGKSGRDKVTIICSPEIADLSAWLEQLLAESTGKLGKGLIPVSEEEVGTPESYGNDRLFVYLKLRGSYFPELDQGVAALEEYGHSLIRVDVQSTYTIGQEFFRWEMATAVAGSILGINPFDQPDVEASKVETRKLTSEIERTGALPEEEPIFEEEGIRVFADARNERELGYGHGLGSGIRPTLAGFLEAHFNRIHPNDYVAILAYLDMNSKNEKALQEMREMIRSTHRVATCLGFGPRFLHSTGQAYKGGPNSGVFLQITADHAHDLSIPGHAYSFGQVEAAEARGDLEVLVARNRRCLRVHLPEDHASALRKLREAIRLALHIDSDRSESGVAA